MHDLQRKINDTQIINLDHWFKKKFKRAWQIIFKRDKRNKK
jgi:hypothetical protein